MKDPVRTLAMLMALAVLCIGCSKTEAPQPEGAAAPKAAADENWEPESADLPEGHSADDGHDHSAHDHDAHEGHDHDAHEPDKGDHAGHDH